MKGTICKNKNVTIKTIDNNTVVTSLQENSTPGVCYHFNIPELNYYTLQYFIKCDTTVAIIICNKCNCKDIIKRIDCKKKIINENTVSFYVHPGTLYIYVLFTGSSKLNTQISIQNMNLVPSDKSQWLKTLDFKTIVITKGVKSFTQKILNTYPVLSQEYSPNKPCIFFGLYRKNVHAMIQKHKSYALLIWGGSDAMVEKNIKFVSTLDRKRFFNIAQSKWISNDLKKYNIPHKQLPWYSLQKNLFKPVTKKDAIYMYIGGLPKKKNFYGWATYEKIKKKINFPIIFGNGKIAYKDMAKNYSKCFIGLRLVPHDGLGSTVQELGLMGIKCVHNGDCPSSLNYTTTDDIINHINNEAKLIGTQDDELADKVDKYLTIDDSFFKVSTWFR